MHASSLKFSFFLQILSIFSHLYLAKINNIFVRYIVIKFRALLDAIVAYQQYVHKQMISKIINGPYNPTNGVNFYCRLDR